VQHEGVNVLAQRRDDEREALGDQPFQSHPAGRCEEIRTDLAALERIEEDALRPALQQPFEIGRRQQLARSSPPSTRISKAPSWTSSLCLPECSASKSELPSFADTLLT
jgi:hypothetical protein